MGIRRGNWVVPIAAALGVGLVGRGVLVEHAPRRRPRRRRVVDARRRTSGGRLERARGDGHVDHRRRHLQPDRRRWPATSGSSRPGMTAYFDALNAQGGVDGRKIEPDLQPGRRRLAQPVHPADPHPDRPGPRLRRRGGVALLHARLLRPVEHPDLRLQRDAATGRPTRISSPPGGSVQDYSSAVPTYAYFVKATHSKALAFISYGPSIASSYDACNTAATDLKAAGVNVSFVDVGAQLGGSFTSDVQRLQQSGSDAADQLHAGLGQHHPGPGHPAVRPVDQAAVAQRLRPDAAQPVLQLMQGVYMSNAGNVPFGAAAYPSTRTRAWRRTRRP